MWICQRRDALFGKKIIRGWGDVFLERCERATGHPTRCVPALFLQDLKDNRWATCHHSEEDRVLLAFTGGTLTMSS